MALANARASGYRTKAEIAHASLQEAILNGSLLPGHRLIVRTIALDLGMSEIPVREALQRLSREGLVESAPHTGARVSDLLVDGVAEILLIRAELEGLATRLAVPRLDAAHFDELERQMTEMDALLASGNLESYGALNRRFHKTIYDLIGYPQLRALILQLWEQEPRARSVFMLEPERARASQAEHRQIIDALRHGDGERAGQLVRIQKLQAMDALNRHRHRGQPSPDRGNAAERG